MAPKKAVRNNNKKKKGKKSTENNLSSANAHDDHRSTATDNNPTPNFWNAITDEQPCHGNHQNGNATSPTGGGIYATYKQATQRFKEGLLALVPKGEMFARSRNDDDIVRVQTMMDAVDVLVHCQQTIPTPLLDDCRTSLLFRKRHAKSFVDGGDEGHSYFILVLQYCFQRLQQLVVVAPATTTKTKHERTSSQHKLHQQQQPTFRFTDFEVGESDDEKDDDDDENEATHIIRPPAPEKDYTMDDLVDSTDRCQAILFLTNVDKCMGVVAQQYAGIRQMAVQLRLDRPGIDDDDYASRLIGPLMTAAAVTNFCIRQVQRMEEEIKFDFPHFTSIYRILASSTLKLQIDDMDQYLKSIGKRVPRSELTAFCGDIVEQGFRLNNGKDDDNEHFLNVYAIIMDLCEKWDLPYEEMETLGLQSLERTRHETGMAAAAHDTTRPHQWTCGYQYIGGGRCILNTLSRLQKLAKTFSSPNQRKYFPSSNGAFWDEQHCLATQIQGDLDRLLMEHILPVLVTMCVNGGPLSHDGIPLLNQLLPFVKHLRQFLVNPQTPVSLSMTFGIHAVLTSIFELQGDNIVANIAKAAENAHRTFFDQLDEWNLHSERFRGVGIRPWDNQNFEAYKGIPSSFVQRGLEDTKSQQMKEHGVWNPYCAGMFLHNVSQAMNMRSVSFMDVHSQLHITLHLYHAFQLRGLMDEDIPLLTSLDDYYGKLITIWGSEKAKRETILTKYWIAEGWKAEIIRAFHKDCCRFVFGQETAEEMYFKFRDGRYNRRAYEQVCRAGDVSKTYRRICEEDFHGMVSIRDEEVLKDGNWEWYMQFERYVNEIVENMTSEAELFSWNLVCLGDCIEGLLYFLADKLGWQDMLDDLVASLGPRDDVDTAWVKRSTIIRRLVHQVLGPLELIDAVVSDPVVVAVRDLFVEYFHALEPSKYKFFNTMKD